MDIKEMTTSQPDLYRCDCCENYSTTRYGLVIQVDFTDEATSEKEGWREYPYQLCRHCYYNWLEGRLSTRELISFCNHNIDRRKPDSSPESC